MSKYTRAYFNRRFKDDSVLTWQVPGAWLNAPSLHNRDSQINPTINEYNTGLATQMRNTAK